MDFCQESGVNTAYIRTLDESTGNAIVQVNDTGENSIVLFGGANKKMTDPILIWY